MHIKCAFVLASFSRAVSGGSVEGTWKEADKLIEQSQEKLAEVHEHANEAAAEEQQVADAARKAMHDSADNLKVSIDELEAAKAKLTSPSATEREPTSLGDSSFLELPESLAQFPGVADDMKKVRAAEKVYEEKMNLLHQKDDELLKMAQADFQEARDVGSMVGNLRSQTKSGHRGSSFLEKHSGTPFQQVLDAEASLKAVNDKLAKEFNFE